MTLVLELQEVSPPVTMTDLLSVYALYPRKGPGKSDGLKVLAKQVKTRTDLALCLQAVQTFAKAHEGKAKEYIRHFDRWARSWRDWLEVDDAKIAKENFRDAMDRAERGVRVRYTPPQAIDPLSPEEARRYAAEQLRKLKGGAE